MQIVASFLLFATSLLGAETYVLGPDSQPQPGVPQGTVTKYKLNPGKFYPGTPHNYAVYVPAQYDAAKPAAFMIFLDGSGSLGNTVRVPIVFDNLIAKRELPPLIGIFVDPGVLPAVSDLAQNRFERVFEYDSLSDRYSRFLLEELIPEVAKKYNLSRDPNDRAISGVSTGAVGAFMAAWNRPDQFRRVLSFIGTYVAMKGADALPALIRKTEPKPIRIFLQDGRNDHVIPGMPYGTFYAGSWPINNQVMFEALEYSGYDAKLAIGDEGHNMKQGAAIMPDALRWLWRDYPKPIEVHAPAAMTQPGWDPRGKVYSTVSPDKLWEQVGETYKAVVSPATDRDGNVFFVDAMENRIYKSDANGKVTLFKDQSGHASALSAGPDGKLYASEKDGRRIVSYDGAGKATVVARDIDSGSIVAVAKGGIYFTDGVHRTVGYLDAGGHKRVVYDGGEIGLPSALALSPDQAMLIVADGKSRFSWSFQILPDESLANGEPFYRLEMPEAGWMSGVQGVTEDAMGQVYFATPAGIQVCEANGRVAQILNPPEHGTVTGVVFGGKDLSWLYVTEGGKLFRRATKVTGSAPWSITKLPKPPL
ncbi:MAG: SMP-30/gluconolactonase/LRE family protein [Acidobacteriota bacterium]|nr:SMP-30/gluconolactonase/LRE family protein [Acidobacteriota bacterium]